MTDDQLIEIKQAISAGQKIRAIKMYREITHSGLKEAKDALEAIERGETPTESVHSSTGSGSVTDFDVAKAIEDELFAGNKIAAIKKYRELTGVGLKVAKDVVEGLEAQLRVSSPEKFGAASKAGCLGMIVLSVFAVFQMKDLK